MGAECRVLSGALLVLALFSSSGRAAQDETLIDDTDPILIDAHADWSPIIFTQEIDLRSGEVIGPRKQLQPTPADVQLDLQSRLKDVQITATPEGYVVHVQTDTGLVELTAEEYVRALGATQARVEAGGFLYRVLNISKPWSFVWICVGLLGQLMFTFRMLLQWWTSEKHKRSIVPVGFWWGSLIGGAMLFAYFCWRKDAIGILGQSTGVFIYARNLVLIYRRRAAAESTPSADEPSNLPAARPT